MNLAGNDPKPCLQPAATPEAKKSYQSPTVKVYGDVRDLTGSGPSHGVRDLALSGPAAKPHFS
jgi:hypothetical protein